MASLFGFKDDDLKQLGEQLAEDRSVLVALVTRDEVAEVTEFLERLGDDLFQLVATDAGVHGPFDGILAAYLLRNLDDPDTQLRAFREILRPGATLAVHEYSVRDSRLASGIWDAVCWGIIIPSGWRQTRDSTLYRHLWRSVKTFDGAADFQRRIAAAGFTGVHSETVPGWQRDIVHTFLGDAPR